MEAFLNSISADEDVSERAAECLQLWSDSMASWEVSKASTMRQVPDETTVLVAIRPHMKIYEELFPGNFLCTLAVSYFPSPHPHFIIYAFTRSGQQGIRRTTGVLQQSVR